MSHRDTIKEDQFDSDPMLFNVKNGTVQLSDMTLQPHNRADLITKISDVEYDPLATCPLWEQFVASITCNRPELALYLQQMCGSILTGNQYQFIWYLFVDGCNGKSVFIDTMIAITGDYHKTMKTESIMAQQQPDGINVDIANIAGARFVTFNETNHGKRLNESRIKELTGGTPVSARKLYKNPFSFVPQCKLWMEGNHPVAISGTDTGIWRRFRIVPFDADLTNISKVDHYEKVLLQQRSGILNWCIAGLKSLNTIGWQEPDCITDAVKKYREEMDTIGMFLTENVATAIGDTFRILKSSLWSSFQEWCSEGNYVQKYNNMTFGKELTMRHSFKYGGHERKCWMNRAYHHDSRYR